MGLSTIDQEHEGCTAALRVTLLAAQEALVVSKTRPGFDPASAATVMELLGRVRDGA